MEQEQHLKEAARSSEEFLGKSLLEGGRGLFVALPACTHACFFFFFGGGGE